MIFQSRIGDVTVSPLVSSAHSTELLVIFKLFTYLEKSNFGEVTREHSDLKAVSEHGSEMVGRGPACARSVARKGLRMERRWDCTCKEKS